MERLMLLEGKNAVIHGGGGAIGGAVARAFAGEGASVFLAGRTRRKLETVAEDIRKAGGNAHVAEVDALDPEAVQTHADDVAGQAGGIDVVLNAIGIPHAQGIPLADLELSDFEDLVGAYMRAHFLIAKASAKHMVLRRAGVILTISTPGSRMSGSGFLGYGVACGAIETFSRILAGELGPSGVRVICLRPDAMPDALATSYTGPMFGRMAEGMGMTGEELLTRRAETIALLRRAPKLKEIADYAAFVASDRAGAMTGAIANLSCGSLVD